MEERNPQAIQGYVRRRDQNKGARAELIGQQHTRPKKDIYAHCDIASASSLDRRESRLHAPLSLADVGNDPSRQSLAAVFEQFDERIRRECGRWLVFLRRMRRHRLSGHEIPCVVRGVLEVAIAQQSGHVEG